MDQMGTSIDRVRSTEYLISKMVLIRLAVSNCVLTARIHFCMSNSSLFFIYRDLWALLAPLVLSVYLDPRDPKVRKGNEGKLALSVTKEWLEFMDPIYGFMEVSAANIIDKYVGESARNVRALFEVNVIKLNYYITKI